MAEKRKPDWVLKIKNINSTSKCILIECFLASAFPKGFGAGKRYRMRIHGKWWVGHPKAIGPVRINKMVFFTKWEIRDIIFKSIMK